MTRFGLSATLAFILLFVSALHADVLTSQSAAVQTGAELPLAPPAFERAVGQPLIASNGSGYLSVWGMPVFGMPISTAGEPQRLTPIEIAAGTPMDVASDGRDYLVLTALNTSLIATIVDADAHVTATTTIPTPFYSPQARLAWNGEKYLLAYVADSVSGRIDGMFLDRRGTPLAAPFTILPARRSPSISIASDGRDFLIAGNQSNCTNASGPSCRSELFTVPVDASGNVGALQTIGGAAAPQIIRRSLVYTGASYVLVWTDSLDAFRSINEVPLDDLGRPRRASTIVATGEASLRTNLLTAGRTGDGAVAMIQHAGRIRATRISRSGDVVDSAPVAIVDSPEVGIVANSADVAASAEGEYIVFNHLESIGSLYFVPEFAYGSVVDFNEPQSGKPLGQQGVAQTIQDLASFGETQLLLYRTSSPLQLNPPVTAEWLSNGKPASEPFELLPGCSRTSIATHNGEFLVVSADVGGTIRAQLLRQGSIDAKTIAVGTGDAAAPSAIWTGDHYLVLWTVTDWSAGPAPTQSLRAMRLRANGDVLDTAPRTVVAKPGFLTGYTRVASTPSGLVAVFQRGTPLFTLNVVIKCDVYAAHISPDGDFLEEPVLIAKTDGVTSSVSDVAVDPTGRIFVTWTESKLVYHSTQPEPARGAVLNSALDLLRVIEFADAGVRHVTSIGNSFLVVSNDVEQYSLDGELMSTVMSGEGFDRRIVSAPAGAFVAYERSDPELFGSTAPSIFGRMLYDAHRRRAVTPR